MTYWLNMPFLSSKQIQNIHYNVFGNDTVHPVIVLIHPLGVNMDVWQHEIPILLQRKYRIITYDLRGHNLTDLGENNRYSMQDLTNDLRDLLEYLKITKCILIGHSVGGKIASLYASQYPDRVDALILISSAAKKIPEENLDQKYTYFEIAKKKGMETLAEKMIEGDKSLKRICMKYKEKYEYFKAMITKTSPDAYIATTKALYTMPDNITQKLKYLNGRLLGIVGSEDLPFIDLLREMKQELPEMRLEVIEGCDHWIVVENPEKLDKILVSFLEELERRAIHQQQP